MKVIIDNIAITGHSLQRYGPGDNYHLENSHVIRGLIHRFQEAKFRNLDKVVVWGSGTPRREFLYVDDMAEACLFIHNLDHNTYKLKTNPISSHINIGTGSDITINELAKIIKSVVGFNGEINFDRSKPDGSPRKLMNVQLLNEMGWSAKIPLYDGLKNSYMDYLKRGFKNEKT